MSHTAYQKTVYNAISTQILRTGVEAEENNHQNVTP